MTDTSECNIRVVCRVRPMNAMEERNGSQAIVKVTGDDSLSMSSKTYNFDQVFKQTCTQEDIYNSVAKPIVADVLSGFNGTIFAYGQTSSGKTFTMEGEIGSPEREGIIPRIVTDIFNYIYQMDENLEFHIKVSYFEIYLDKIRDLLDISKTNLVVHEDKNRVPYVKGATERFVSSPEEVLDTIEEGKMNRHVSVTNMNEHSSRSHSVLMINIKQENTETEKKLNGKLYLVDLAGSEKVSKTGAEGSTLDEAKNINKSLSALGNVIAALADGNKAHVPYRDSKLTRILQESLGGNARTTIVICCSPASYNESETKSTLLFGVRAKTIKNVVTVNEELTADEWRRRWEKEKERSSRLRQQIMALETELVRWRRGESVATDEQAQLISHMLGAVAALPPGTDLAAGLQSMTPSLSLTQLSSISTPSLPSLTADERKQYEEEKRRLCEQLDEKDDDYTESLEKLEKFRQQVQDLEDLVAVRQREFDTQQGEMQRMQAENDAAKEEVKEVLTALEELAANYEQKSQEADVKRHENELLAEELTSKLSVISAIENELDRLKEQSLLARRRVADIVHGLLRDINDAVQVLPGPQPTPPGKNGEVSAESLEDDVTNARMYVSKMKSDIKNLLSKIGAMEREHGDFKRMEDGIAAESAALREAAKERQIRVELAEQQLSEAESRQAQLETELEQANTELAKLRGSSGSSDQAQAAEATPSPAVEQLHRQLGLVRQEVRDKQAALEQLRESNRQLTSAVDRLQMELERARRDDADKAAQLAELQLAAERREQARQELRGLEETVNKELQTLHTLRRLFVQDLQAKLKRWTASAQAQPGSTGESAGDAAATEDENGTAVPGAGSVIAQRQKINFLETNLEQLTKVHKQLVRDNADLRCELPKLEKRLRTTMDRVKTFVIFYPFDFMI